jgi:hypothetical protein
MKGVLMGRWPMVRNVNEDLIVKRYTVAKWPVARCAREQGISYEKAKGILAKHGVELRTAARELNPEKVLAAHEEKPNVEYLVSLFSTERKRILKILDDAGVQRPARGREPVRPARQRRRQ